jgi:hypothetical protein
MAPTNRPTTSPTTAPTQAPSEQPTELPSESPTTAPTNVPTTSPTTAPSVAPSEQPTETPSESPTMRPTVTPTTTPTNVPTKTPTESPTNSPSAAPSLNPTESPSELPTKSPTVNPTESPTKTPTKVPTEQPTAAPTPSPSPSPTSAPTPTKSPSQQPTAPTLSPTTPAPTLYQPEIFIKEVVWGSSVTTIELTFSAATNTPGGSSGFDCRDLFEISNILSFGSAYDGIVTNQYCKWLNYKKLVIALGVKPTVIPGDILRFNTDNTNCDVWICHRQVEGRLKFTANLTIIVPEIETDLYPAEALVEGPAAVGLCDDIHIMSISKGGYGRSLTYEWQLLHPFKELQLNNDQCKGIVTNSSDLIIPSTCTADSDPASLHFKLRVTNWLNMSDIVNVFVDYTASVIPQVTVLGGNVHYTSRINSLEIPINVEMPSCNLNSDYDLQYSWKQGTSDKLYDLGWSDSLSVNTHELELADVQTSSKNLVLDAYTTNWGKYYTFTLTVTYLGSISNYTLVGVKTYERPSPSARSSVDVIFSSSTKNELLLTDIFDFFSHVKEREIWWKDVAGADNEDEAISVLYDISWTCSHELEDGNSSSCRISMAQYTNQLSLKWTGEEISRSFYTQTNYLIGALVQSKETGEISVGSASMIVEEARYPAVRMLPDTVSLAIGEQITFVLSVVKSADIGYEERTLYGKDISLFYNVTWSTSPSLAHYDYALTIYENTATVDTSTITNDLIDEVVVHVHVTPLDEGEVFNEGQVSKYSTVAIVTPPRMGYCEVFPDNGTPFSTLFVVRCLDWLSESTLRYQFGYLLLNSTSNVESTLRTYTQSASHEFTMGPGSFRIRSQIKDESGSVVEVTNDISCEYSAEETNEIGAHWQSYIGNLSAIANYTDSAANVGDVSTALSNIALLNTGVEYLLSIMDEGVIEEVILLKQKIVEILQVLHSSMVSTVVSLEAVMSTLRSTVSDWTILSESSVITVTDLLEAIIRTYSDLLSQENVSKFSSTNVVQLVETVNSILLNDIQNTTTVQRLRDLTEACLRESLRDTQPGQMGFSTMTMSNDDSSYYAAKRVSTGSFSECSTAKTWLPDLIPEFRLVESADCITMISAEGTGSRRRQDIDNAQEVISIHLYDTSGELGNEPVSVTSLDACTPIVYFLESVDTPDLDYKDVEREAVAIAESDSSTTDVRLSLPNCMSRDYFGYDWTDRGCKLIGWEKNRTWCSCTQLLETSVGSRDVTIFLNVSTVSNSILFDVESMTENSSSLFLTIIFVLVICKLLPESRMRLTDIDLLAHPCLYTNNRYHSIGINSAYYKRLKAYVTKSFFGRWRKLFDWEVRNNHPVFGIWYRDMGTNFTGHQRIYMLFVGLAVAFASQAIYYGMTYSQPIDEFTEMIAVAIVLFLLSSLAKHVFQNRETHMFKKNIFEAERSRMQDCRAICRYLYCCCFCTMHCKRQDSLQGEGVRKDRCNKVEISRATREPLFAAHWAETCLLDEETDFILTDRRGDIVNREHDQKNYPNLNEEEERSKRDRLAQLQLRYLEASHGCPSYCRPLLWIIFSIILAVCVLLLLSFGPNFDKHEFSIPDLEIQAAGTSHCQTWFHDEIPMFLDVSVSSALELLAANASAAAVNDEFSRYPEPVIQIYSQHTTETLRFFVSAILAWIVGMVCLPLLFNVGSAFAASVNNCYFSAHMLEIAEQSDFKGREKLSKEDFKFLLIFFPEALLDIDRVESGARPILRKGRCTNIFMIC